MDGVLELYRIFYTVANYGNISAAAQNLHITQPAVSRSIKKWEDHIGIRLFSRSSRGVKLTCEGKLFYAYVEKAMSEITKGEELVKKLLQRETGKITLSVSTTLFKALGLHITKICICPRPPQPSWIQWFSKLYNNYIKINAGIIMKGS